MKITETYLKNLIREVIEGPPPDFATPEAGAPGSGGEAPAQAPGKAGEDVKGNKARLAAARLAKRVGMDKLLTGYLEALKTQSPQIQGSFIAFVAQDLLGISAESLPRILTATKTAASSRTAARQATKTGA